MSFSYSTDSPSYTFIPRASGTGLDVTQPYWINALVGDWKLEMARFGMTPPEAVGVCFPTRLPAVFPFSDFLALNALSSPDRTKVWEILRKIEAVIDVRFYNSNDATDTNTISLFQANLPSGISGVGYALQPGYYAGAAVVSEDIDVARDPYGGYTVLHEIMHTLGLSHPFEGVVQLKEQEDKHAATLQSYIYSEPFPSTGEFYFEELAPLDIAALQYLYGPSKSARTGNDTYRLDGTKANFVWDGGGIDTLDASTSNTGATIHLTPSEWGFFGAAAATFITAPGQIVVNPSSVIENAIGTASNDIIHGNDHSNTLRGNDGNDWLAGRAGNDILDGGRGIDTAAFSGARSDYSVLKSNTGLSVSDATGMDGNDTLLSIERLQFTDKSLAFDLHGNAGEAAKIIGSVFGRSAVKDAFLVGIGISMIDAGISAENLAEAALAHVLGNNFNSTAVASLLHRNIIGIDATTNDLASLSSIIDSGAYSIGSFTLAAASLDMNLANIDFVGLSTTGLTYLPQPIA